MCMWEQGVYGKSLYMPLNFAVNLNCSKNKGLEKNEQIQKNKTKQNKKKFLFSCSVVCNSLQAHELYPVVCQASLSMKFSRKEYWSGQTFPSPGDLLDPDLLQLQVDSLLSEPPGKPSYVPSYLDCLGGVVVKNPPGNAGDAGLIPGSGRFPWRRKWQPTPGLLPG